MTTQETRALSKTTPITITFALMLCAGAFWSGRQSMSISTNEINIQSNKILIERLEITNNLTQQLLREVAQYNKYMEKRIERLENK